LLAFLHKIYVVIIIYRGEPILTNFLRLLLDFAASAGLLVFWSLLSLSSFVSTRRPLGFERASIWRRACWLVAGRDRGEHDDATDEL